MGVRNRARWPLAARLAVSTAGIVLAGLAAGLLVAGLLMAGMN
ncbi:MAG TPA: hypothetical protein VLX31_11165 [Streptosporangiaceae bacterium]|nr:hypothetical protein [Streptosporangiaceae bacterium]